MKYIRDRNKLFEREGDNVPSNIIKRFKKYGTFSKLGEEDYCVFTLKDKYDIEFDDFSINIDEKLDVLENFCKNKYHTTLFKFADEHNLSVMKIGASSAIGFIAQDSKYEYRIGSTIYYKDSKRMSYHIEFDFYKDRVEVNSKLSNNGTNYASNRYKTLKKFTSSDINKLKLDGDNNVKDYVKGQLSFIGKYLNKNTDIYQIMSLLLRTDFSYEDEEYFDALVRKIPFIYDAVKDLCSDKFNKEYGGTISSAEEFGFFDD